MNRHIYVDNAATTPLSEVALAAMLPYLTDGYGNASAIHRPGQQAKIALETARRKIAEALGAYVNEIYFTSGGTESDNWALQGAVERETALSISRNATTVARTTAAGMTAPGCPDNTRLEKRYNTETHIIISSIEHSAVYHTAKYLETLGHEVTYLPVDEHGLVTPDQLIAAIRENTALVSIMLANNEVGTIQPLQELCKAAKAENRSLLFHTDAVQAVGRIPVNVRELGIDILSFSAHKFGGPQGVGGQFIKLGMNIPALIKGGGQEKGRRSGTSNVSGIVGMAAALEQSVEAMDETTPRISRLRNRLIEAVLKIPGTRLTGDRVARLPGSASFVIDGLAHRPLIARLSEYGIYASAGSSCSSSSEEPSRILLAMGCPENLAAAPLRLTLGRQNTEAEIDYIAEKLEYTIARLRTERFAPTSLDFDAHP